MKGETAMLRKGSFITAILALGLASCRASQTYRNTQAGYTIDYPASWVVEEYLDLATNTTTTTFTPADDMVGVAVSVQNRQLDPAEMDAIIHMPNSSCRQVIVGGLTGWQCYTTMGPCHQLEGRFTCSTTTTLVGQGKTYSIRNDYVKGPDLRGLQVLAPEAYQRFLDSFALIPQSASTPSETSQLRIQTTVPTIMLTPTLRLTNTPRPSPTPISCKPDSGEEHEVSLSIPAEIAGVAAEGQASFVNKRFTGVDPCDRLTFHIKFPDQLVVKGTPPFVALSIDGEHPDISAMAIGLEPIVDTEGSLSIVWNNGGIMSSDATIGTIDGFWINLSNANTPQDGQALRSLRVSFVVPTTILSNPIQENQDISVVKVSWRNLGSPTPPNKEG
jgi:hypothetical protein